MELFKFKQSESMSNSEYMEKLKGLVEVFISRTLTATSLETSLDKLIYNNPIS